MKRCCKNPFFRDGRPVPYKMAEKCVPYENRGESNTVGEAFRLPQNFICGTGDPSPTKWQKNASPTRRKEQFMQRRVA